MIETRKSLIRSDVGWVVTQPERLWVTTQRFSAWPEHVAEQTAGSRPSLR